MITTAANVSFVGPFPTTYTPSAACSAISSEVIVGIDFASSCLPKDFDGAPTAYYSPGTACPSGYTAQDSCTRSTGTDATTITCCPVRDVVTMWCVESPESLSDAWVSMMCTWSAGEEKRIFVVTSTATDSTVVSSVTMTGGDGINAYGLKMVYAPSDLATTATDATTTATEISETTSSAPTNDTSNDTTSDDSSGLSTGAIAAIGVAVPVVAIAVLIGVFFWYRRRKQRYGAVGADEPKELPPNTAAAKYHTTGDNYQTSPGSQVASELHGSVISPQELPSQTFVSELPAEFPHGRTPSRSPAP